MHPFYCVSDCLLKDPTEEFAVDYSFYSFTLYRKGELIKKKVLKERILSVSISEYITIIHRRGIEQYAYDSPLRIVRDISIERILKAQIIGNYALITTFKEEKRTTLYKIDSGIHYLLDINTEEHPLVRIDKRAECDLIILSYKNHVRHIEYVNGILQEIAENGMIRDKIIKNNPKRPENKIRNNLKAPRDEIARDEIIKRSFLLDKRNILRVSDTSIQHERITTQRILTTGKDPLIKVGPAGMEISSNGNRHFIHREYNRYRICSEEDHNKHSNSRMRSEDHPRSSIRDTFLSPVLLEEGLFSFIHGKYIHYVRTDGYITVIQIVDGRAVVNRLIGPVNTAGLTGFYAFSTHFSTLAVLLYGSEFTVWEFSYEQEIKSVLSVDRIRSVRKYRKNLLIEYANTYKMYSLGKDRSIQEADLARIDVQSLDAPNVNVQLLPVIRVQEKKDVVEWGRSVHVEDDFIRHFHLLHSGYVYSNGFELVINSEKVSFGFFIKRISVSSTSERSTVLVCLVTGAVYLVSVVGGRVVGKIEVFQRMLPDKMQMVSLDSFMTVTEGLFVLFGGKEYVQPIIRVTVSEKIEDVLFTNEEIILLTENRTYVINRRVNAQPTAVTPDDSIGVYYLE